MGERFRVEKIVPCAPLSTADLFTRPAHYTLVRLRDSFRFTVKLGSRHRWEVGDVVVIAELELRRGLA